TIACALSAADERQRAYPPSSNAVPADPLRAMGTSIRPLETTGRARAPEPMPSRLPPPVANARTRGGRLRNRHVGRRRPPEAATIQLPKCTGSRDNAPRLPYER